MPYPNTFHDANLEPGMALGAIGPTVALTADNQFINVSYKRFQMVRLTSDNTTAANRTFTLSGGAIDGHLLYLHFVSGSSTTCQLADSGNVALSAAWEPLQNDTLTLMWDATSAVWRELSRADN
jgi:hypothetical protein